MAGIPTEFDLIADFFAPLAAGHPGSFGLGDDAAAILNPAGTEQIVTTDALIAGVHFFADDPARSIAVKALGVNLSDLAAMGARPVAYTLAAAWPPDITSTWIEAFVEGLAWMQAEHGIHLVGGDTVSTPGPLSLSITAIGTVPEGQALRRNGARDGDLLFVSGTIGDAALGLRLLNGEISADILEDTRRHLIGRYRDPQPRTSVGPDLIGLAQSAVDISDGLIADVGHLAVQSQMRISIDLSAIPLSFAAQEIVGEDPELIASICGGGDDYELAFTVAPARITEVEDLAHRSGLALSPVGQVRDPGMRGPGVDVVDGQGNRLEPADLGFRHF